MKTYTLKNLSGEIRDFAKISVEEYYLERGEVEPYNDEELFSVKKSTAGVPGFAIKPIMLEDIEPIAF